LARHLLRYLVTVQLTLLEKKMKKPFKKIMLVTNKPSDTAGAEKTAIKLAQANRATILLADSIKTPFQASRLASMSTELMYEAAVAAKQAYLAELQSRFNKAGIESTSKVLVSPRTSTELIRTVVEEDCDLVIRYLKGESSKAAGRFGETAENLMRACPVPVLLTEREISNPKVVACINLEHGKEENQAILESARRVVSSPEELSVISCWEYSGRDFMFEYMDEGMYEQTRDEASELVAQMADRLKSENDLEDLGDRVQLISESPVTAIPRFCEENEIDIAVMCSASLNHPLGRKLGSTIERTIGSLPCALLAVKPVGFEATKSESNPKLAQVV
jgi:nucleotide-binding universal stress UspA family protein